MSGKPISAADPIGRVCLGRLGDLPDGGLVPVRVRGLHLVLARHSGRVIAAERACPHEGADLAQGRCAGGRLHCPHHRATFDLATGAVSPGWSFRPLRVAAVRVEAGWLWIEADALAALAGPR
jgi:3-phenylpropionate/trans-cinnamate dioxygenase ferredoxin component